MNDRPLDIFLFCLTQTNLSKASFYSSIYLSLVFCSILMKYRWFSQWRHRKINSKPFNEISQEQENVVEDQYINNLSRSHVFVIHRFWVICRSVARNFIEFCMESPCWWATMAAGNQQKHLELTLRWKRFFIVRQYICVQTHLLIYLKRLN